MPASFDFNWPSRSFWHWRVLFDHWLAQVRWVSFLDMVQSLQNQSTVIIKHLFYKFYYTQWILGYKNTGLGIELGYPGRSLEGKRVVMISMGGGGVRPNPPTPNPPTATTPATALIGGYTAMRKEGCETCRKCWNPQQFIKGVCFKWLRYKSKIHVGKVDHFCKIPD